MQNILKYLLCSLDILISHVIMCSIYSVTGKGLSWSKCGVLTASEFENQNSYKIAAFLIRF